MHIIKAISASTSFFEMIDSTGVNSGGLAAPEVSAHGDIELNNITFAYPTRPGIQVLKDFSAVFAAGKTTALVGPSGSGKSTIVALLERWYDLIGEEQLRGETTSNHASNIEVESGEITEKDPVPSSSGSISTSAHNINDFQLRWWRSQIGLVQQEPFLFNDTIEVNVAHGLIGTEWEHADAAKRFELVKDACKEAFADDFIDKLPSKYGTIVGEGGIKLSGGQRQRIAIARSIIRKPAILILDEATSSIDVQGEKIVQAALDRASKDRTTIMIAHRLSTIRKADHIIVLRNGGKVEEGTHEYLMSNSDGLYSRLVQAQQIEEDRTAPEQVHAGETGVDTDKALDQALMQRERTRSFASSHATKHDVETGEATDPDGSYKKKGFFRTAGVLLFEQRTRWPLYGLVVIAAMGCACKLLFLACAALKLTLEAAFALQSWFFAQLVQTFQYTGQRLVDAANHWALWFFILAVLVAICYATLGTASATVSTVSCLEVDLARLTILSTLARHAAKVISNQPCKCQSDISIFKTIRQVPSCLDSQTTLNNFKNSLD